ncbi:hypothetical protein SOVF_129900 [Spinacia oleracea]|uniref:Cyclin-dependent protein kinase inhibitor SMR15 n=1 Tax=Spinacia oleracea TaxID=3562 RepID=A0A9R0J2F9_SPIOL|nr:cyclin-dependent protein kinase inhibitor SMR15-like [Spinacia oleracea]KNA12009.1 hypothetical protein SOVF_129900 [Spinacia oleracea]
MRFSSEKKSANWVTNTPLRAPLKPIYTGGGRSIDEDQRENTTSSSVPTTPTSEGSRIPSKLPCPPPPRKRKPSSSKQLRCKNINKLCSGKREFFITPTDLEAVFIRRHNIGC